MVEYLHHSRASCSIWNSRHHSNTTTWHLSMLFFFSSSKTNQQHITYLTISPRRTRKLLRTHRLMRIFSSDTVSSDKTMQTVSFRRLPFIRTVSPRNSCSSSILFYSQTPHDVTVVSFWSRDGHSQYTASEATSICWHQSLWTVYYPTQVWRTLLFTCRT